MAITKAEAIEIFGTVEALRDALGLKTRQAIYMWPDGPIPEPHELKIRYVLIPGLQGGDVAAYLDSREKDPGRHRGPAVQGEAAETDDSSVGPLTTQRAA